MSEAAYTPEAFESQLIDRVREHRMQATVAEAFAQGANLTERASFETDQVVSTYDPKSVVEHGMPWYARPLAGAEPLRFAKALVGGAIPEAPFASAQQLLRAVRELPIYDSTAEDVESQKISMSIGEGMSLELAQYEPGRMYHRIATDPEVPAEIRYATLEKFIERVRQTQAPFDQSMSEIRAQLQQGQPEAYTNHTFNFRTNPAELLAYLDPSIHTWINNRNMSLNVAKVMEELYGRLPAHYAGESVPQTQRQGIYFDERGRITKVLLPYGRQAGVYIAMRTATPEQTGDLDDIDLQIGVEVDSREAYLAEQGDNGTRKEHVVPFIETPAAQQILSAFAGAGLEITPRFMDSFAEVGQHSRRYGHGYADATREIAKLVNTAKLANGQNRTLSHLFEGDEQDIAVRLQNMGSSSDPAANVMLDLLRAVTNRNFEPTEGVVDLPLSQERIEIKNGSCKDIEIYLADGYLEQGTDGLLWRSQYVVPTVVTLRPVKLAGIVLPAGTLLTPRSDGYLMMRITAYAFSAEESAEVFGAQEAENARHDHYLFRGAAIRERIDANR